MYTLKPKRHAFPADSVLLLLLIPAVCSCTLQAQDAFLDLGNGYAQTLAELPMLQELWHRAAAFDPITHQLALMVDPMAGTARLQQAAAERAGSGLGRPGWWRHLRHRHSAPPAGLV